MSRIISKLFRFGFRIILFNIKLIFIMSEKSNKTWSIILTIVKYAITVVLGALGASNIDQVSNLLTL